MALLSSFSRHAFIGELMWHEGKGGLPESFWKQLLRSQANLFRLSLSSALMSEHLTKSPWYASYQQDFKPVSFVLALLTLSIPFSSLRASIENSATTSPEIPRIFGGSSLDCFSACEGNQDHDKPMFDRERTNRKIRYLYWAIWVSFSAKFFLILHLINDHQFCETYIIYSN